MPDAGRNSRPKFTQRGNDEAEDTDLAVALFGLAGWLLAKNPLYQGIPILLELMFVGLP
jgi:hypothetical protein